MNEQNDWNKKKGGTRYIQIKWYSTFDAATNTHKTHYLTHKMNYNRLIRLDS